MSNSKLNLDNLSAFLTLDNNLICQVQFIQNLDAITLALFSRETSSFFYIFLDMSNCIALKQSTEK